MLRGPPIEVEVQSEMEKLETFNYLQYAYYKLGNGVKAAHAAFTYSAKHPENEDMKYNLYEFYKAEYPDVKRLIEEHKLINYELPMYNKFFQEG
jgi:hypothetical protein